MCLSARMEDGHSTNGSITDGWMERRPPHTDRQMDRRGDTSVPAVPIRFRLRSFRPTKRPLDPPPVAAIAFVGRAASSIHPSIHPLASLISYGRVACRYPPTRSQPPLYSPRNSPGPACHSPTNLLRSPRRYFPPLFFLSQVAVRRKATLAFVAPPCFVQFFFF